MPETNTDSGTTDSIEEQPSSEIVPGGASAELAAVLEKALEPFRKDLDEVKNQQRALQSGKDRGIEKVEGKLEKVLAEWEQAKKSGLSQEEFIQQKDRDDRLARIETMLASQPAPTKPSGGTENSGALTMARAIAKVGHIEESDTDYLRILASNINNPLKLAEEMSALVVDRATKPIPTSAQAPSPSATPTHGKNVDELMVEYNQALTRDPFGSATKKLKQELESLNWGR